MPLEQRADVGEAHVVAGRDVAAGQRDLEVELAEPVGQPDLAEGQTVGQRTERGVVQRHQRLGQGRGGYVDRPPRALLLDVAAQLGLEVGRGRVGDLEHSVHQRAERGA